MPSFPNKRRKLTDGPSQKDADGLTDRQRAFIREYLVDLNAGAAAIRAGYASKTARDTGAKVLGHPVVAKAIKKAMDERAKRTEITADMVLRELAKVGFSDLRDVATWTEDGVEFKPSADLDDDAAKTIKSVKSKRRTTTDKEGNISETVELEITREDKVAALEKIGRHLGMFNDKLTLTHEYADLPDDELDRRIAEAERRKAAQAVDAADD